MSSKSSTKKMEPQPVVRFYLAESFRPEVNGKMSAIGMYLDNVVVLNIPDDAPDPTESKPIVIRGLSLAFNVSKVKHAPTITVEIEENGKRRPFIPATTQAFPGVGRSIILVAALEPCSIIQLGEKKLIVTVDKTEHTFVYEFRRESAPSVVTVSGSEISIPKPKKASLAKSKRTASPSKV